MKSWLILPLLVLYLLNLGAVGFLGPDEPRYASIGREMAHSGDWVTPRLNGSPWFEKPPLLYWMTGIATRAGLRDEWAARLPVALASIAFLVFFFATLEREFSPRIAAIATAILGTSIGWLACSFAAITDLPMTAALGSAMLIALFDTRPHRGFLSGAMLGLAILAKAFVPVVLFAPVWLIARGKRLAVIVAAAIVALPWFILCWMRNGNAFWNEFFWHQQVQRFTSPEFHPQPVWYYLPILIAGLFPWTPLIALLARPKTYDDSRMRFLISWVILGLIFFSTARNGLPAYILPLIPALAVVLAVALDKAPGAAWWIGICAVLMVVLPSVAAMLPDALMGNLRRVHWPFVASGLVFVIPAAAACWLARARSAALGVLVTALTVIVGVEFLKVRSFPLLDQQASARGFWRSHPEAASACVDYSVPAPWEYGLNYYAGRALPRCEPGAQGLWIIDKQGILVLQSPVLPARP